nr:alanine racemase [Pseudoduganella rivuli]
MAGGATAAALALARPHVYSGGHASYFSGLNAALRRAGVDRPVVVIDLDRLDRNIDRVAASARAGTARNVRIVAKSLPSPDLIAYIARRAGAQSAMVFHHTHLQALTRCWPTADLLLGKPMPVAALEAWLGAGPRTTETATAVQWLVDTEQRLAQYLQVAAGQCVPLRISLEIDVGLHRGGFASADALAGALRMIAAQPRSLVLSGFMGYDGHVMGLPGPLAEREMPRVKARYAGFIDVLRRHFPALAAGPLIFNGAGSPTFRYHESGSPLNDIAVGSALVKPGHYDLPALVDFEPAAYIATPVLKRQASTGIPTMEWLAGPIAAWDGNRADTLFAYGGNWLAEPVSPAGVRRAAIYASSNQEGYDAASGVVLAADDFLFLRPTQSEAVLLQFGDLIGVRGGQVACRWPAFAAS